MDRRAFLNGIIPAVAGAAVIPSWANGAPAGHPDTGMPTPPDEGPMPGLIIREKEPVNLEFPFPTLKERITPNNRFFIRTHFPVPKIEAAGWQLKIEGEVRTPTVIGYDELRKLPAKKVMATIECAGNGRAFLVPKAKGLLWEQGGVGTAEWTGVPLSVLLDRAGIKEGTVEVILEGADQGEISEEPKTPGAIHFARSLPLQKARQPEVILAYQMNGKDLTPEHGFPVRAVIPGWYGMASVKWLSRIIATNRPFDGYFQSLEYAYWKRNSGLPTLTPVTTVQVKAEIARPMLHEVVASGKPYRIYGAAWSGESEVTKVEVSTDEGVSWQPAALLDKPVPFAWRLWEFTWQVSGAPGKRKLMARATDNQGNVQAPQHDPDRRSYMINMIEPIEIEIQ
ncbi:MAG: sulfite oxidase [Williamsia sp.]|nr:sulfite oxidase [Williamsia sp.]